MPDLAPSIHRQRLVVEGECHEPIDAPTICEYLRRLSEVCDMIVLLDPVTHRSDRYGWAGWIHWETSGAHFYAWETPLYFFSVDIYTCKPFDPIDVVEFTAEFLNTKRVVAKGF
jgi:S-adenosylmethionine decarboxylase